MWWIRDGSVADPPHKKPGYGAGTTFTSELTSVRHGTFVASIVVSSRPRPGCVPCTVTVYVTESPGTGSVLFTTKSVVGSPSIESPPLPSTFSAPTSNG